MRVESIDNNVATMISKWITRRGPQAGRYGGLVTDDFEALDRLLGRPAKRSERSFLEQAWEKILQDSENQ
jgi:hypothetical protein